MQWQFGHSDVLFFLFLVLFFLFFLRFDALKPGMIHVNWSVVFRTIFFLKENSKEKRQAVNTHHAGDWGFRLLVLTLRQCAHLFFDYYFLLLSKICGQTCSNSTRQQKAPLIWWFLIVSARAWPVWTAIGCSVSECVEPYLESILLHQQLHNPVEPWYQATTGSAQKRHPLFSMVSKLILKVTACWEAFLWFHT